MRTILITGSSRGIGREIAKGLVKRGFQVIINYRKSKEDAEELKKELQDQGYSNFRIYKADISKREEAKKIVEYTIKEFGGIDVLINNAGIDQIKLFTDITDYDWNNMIENNLNSVFYMTQEAVKNMLTNKKGIIINISSIWGVVGASCEVHYSATKAAIDGMTKSLAKELGPSNIRVNSIAPGIIDTQMNENLTKNELEEIKNEIPLGKIGKKEEILKCILWLLEDEYTTGQIIQINGGWNI